MASHVRGVAQIFLAAAVIPFRSASGQMPVAKMSGTVIDATTRASISNAEIIHLTNGRSVTTDSLGRYLFADVPSGIARFLVRVRGFPATSVTVALARGDSLARVIELDSSLAGRSAAQAIPALSVVAPREPLPRYVDFERRRLTGRGQYVTRQDIEKANYATLQDAMRGLRGVDTECGGGGSGCTIRMVRAPMRCRPEYIIDERVDNDFGPGTAIRDIEGIEVYTGPSDVPGEFAGRNAGCGVIVVWTRAGPSHTRSR
jgi:CarboxypepD_reg-like domain/TonB-dependent Receptor Plug Domain